ncbi:hypothetical protein MOQ95_004891 [Salmonella enterica]|nr:hypothetical protein [Salmonella enterica]
MDYAIDEMTGVLVSASRASRYGQYTCPVCKKGVIPRKGDIRVPYFAHRPGYGTLECENFVLGHSSLLVPEKEKINVTVKRRMELRLLILAERKRREWSLKLALPTCNLCRARITLDVGGRSQTLDMRSMVKRRQIGAEPSAQPYRIVSFSGDPDPEFAAEVERECQGLPPVGAAVFTNGTSEGFPLARELRCNDIFAFLWQQPVQPDFPDELTVDRLPGRQGWYLALVTIPETPSSESIAWLKCFTHLPVVPAKSSITAIWPFLTQNTSVNQIECLHSNTVLLSANMVSTTSIDGPTMYAQGASSLLSATGVEKSPAFFTLNPGHSEFVGVSDASDQDIKIFLTFSSHVKCFNKYPSVDLVFTKQQGGQEIVSLHQRRCATVTTEARLQGHKLEYLSMPPGAEGVAKIEGITENSNIRLFSSSCVAPHDANMCLLQPDVLSRLAFYLADSTCHLEIEFSGLGRLSLPGFYPSSSTVDINKKLSSALRSRLFSFILQIRLVTPNFIVSSDDSALIEALEKLQPELHQLPHYRALVKEIIASGFEFNRLR